MNSSPRVGPETSARIERDEDGTLRSVRPGDDEIDLFGITDPGLVRNDNQDHFFIAMVHPQINVFGTSLPSDCALPLRGTRLGTILMVADGVGGSADGATAARLATMAVADYISASFRSYHEAGAGRGEGQEPEQDDGDLV